MQSIDTTQLKSYLDVLIEQREWSWTLLAMTYLLIGFVIRNIFLGIITQSLKMLPRKYHHEIKSEYLKRAAVGWAFFLLPLIALIPYCRQNL